MIHITDCLSGGYDVWYDGVHVGWARTRAEAVAVGRSV